MGQRLTFGQSLTFGQEASGTLAAELAQYQVYLPLLIRQVFVESRGELDPSFDGDGIVSTDFGIYFSQAHDLLLQPDGKIVLAGSFSSGYGYGGFALLRYK